MRVKWLQKSMLLVALIAFGAGLGACGDSGNECALGTVEVDGQCVPFCSQSEYWNGTECVGIPTCAAGTVLNPATGECEPACEDGQYWTGTACAAVPTCADGTVFNAQSGECEPACAAGQYWDGTACAAVPNCPAGYELNETTGVCEALCAPGTYWDTTTEGCVDNCGEGTVLNDGVCMPWIDVVESDVMEAAENNDAFLGGVPGMFTLPAIDESIILEGVIDSVTDLDGDGYGDADWDTWVFSASQGQRLNVAGWADGLFNVATVIVGMDEGNMWYQRYGLTPDSPESQRDFVIPMDGEYLLAVTDYSNLVSDIPVGGPELGYFVSVTQIANPAPIAGSLGSAQAGTVFDIDQLTFTGTAGELYDVTINSLSEDVVGVIPVHNLSGDFLQELETMYCSWFGCFPITDFTMPMPADGGMMLTMDYQYRTGSNGDYSITVDLNPNVEDLDVTTSAVLNEDLGSAEGEKIYRIDAVAGNLYSIAFENLGADVDASLYATIHDENFVAFAAVDTEYDSPPWEFRFYAQADARYFIKVIDWYQEAGSDYTYDLVINVYPVEDLGTLDATNTTITSAGEGPVANAGDEFWFAATTDQAAEVMGSFAPTVAWNLAVEIYDLDLMMLAWLDDMGDGVAETFEYVIPAGTYLFRVTESGMDMGDASYTFDISMSYEELQQEVEPNDDYTTATTMQEEAIAGYFDTADDIDWYSYTVDGQGILFFWTGPGDFDADTYLWMYDTDGTTLLMEHDDNDYYGGDWFSTTYAEVEAGSYYAAVGTYYADSNYVLYAEFVEGACIPGNSYCVDENNAMVCNDMEAGYEAVACDFGCGEHDGVEGCLPPELDEVEPNDDFANANEIVLDYDGSGEITTGDNDYYMFTLNADAVVTITTYELLAGAGTDTRLWLFDSTEAQLASNDDGGDGLYSMIAMPLSAGTYYVQVGAWSWAIGYYGLTVTAAIPICTPGQTQCNVDGNLETCNAAGTAWDVTVCNYGCDDTGGAVCNPPTLDEVEPNDTVAEATVIGFPYFGLGYLSSYDLDYYMFTLPADGTVIIETDAFSGDPDTVDTQLTLYADDGTTELGYDDDGGNGLYSYIEMDLTAGDYYIAVNPFSSSTGYYTLSVNFWAPNMIISEYIEGSSNNKALEFTNLDNVDVDLSNCEWSNYNNGGTTVSNTFTFAAVVLAPGESYVVCNTSGIVTNGGSIPDASCDALGNVFVNGDDAIVLSCNGTIVDSFGRVGEDPGTAWGTGEYTTADNTLRRNCDVISGDTIHDDEFDPSIEWSGFGTDVFDGLGVHCP